MRLNGERATMGVIVRSVLRSRLDSDISLMEESRADWFWSDELSGLKDKFKHAFAVDGSGAAEPTERQREVIDYLCRSIVRRHMTTPAITFLEMSRPMNYLFANALYFAQPAASILARLVGLIAGSPATGFEDESAGERARFREEDWTPVAEFLEKRGSFDYFCRRIEFFEAEYAKGEKKGLRH